MKQTKNFIFDLYGTLADIHTDESLPELWEWAADFLKNRDIHYGPSELRKRYAALCGDYQERKDREASAEGLEGPTEIDLINVWTALIREKGGSLSAEKMVKFTGSFRIRSTEYLRLYPYAAEVLEKLRETGKTLILLTNAQACYTETELDRLGIARAFDHIFISSRVGFKKPSPVFFAELWKAGIDPDESLMIGNDEVCDCQGAAAAGMRSLFIRTPQSPAIPSPLPQNCREIRSLAEILEFS